MRSRNVNPLGGVVVLAGLAAIALVNWASGGRFFTVVAAAVGIYVAWRVGRKIRRTRRRAEAVAVQVKLSPSEVTIEASHPGHSKTAQSVLHGRLQGLRDAKQAARIGAEKVTFDVNGEIDARWFAGYTGGVHEILPDADINRNYAPQSQGSNVA